MGPVPFLLSSEAYPLSVREVSESRFLCKTSDSSLLIYSGPLLDRDVSRHGYDLVIQLHQYVPSSLLETRTRVLITTDASRPRLPLDARRSQIVRSLLLLRRMELHPFLPRPHVCTRDETTLSRGIGRSILNVDDAARSLWSRNSRSSVQGQSSETLSVRIERELMFCISLAAHRSSQGRQAQCSV